MASEKGEVEDIRSESLPPMPTARVFAATATHEGDLFVIGGCDARGIPLSDAEVLFLPWMF